LLIERAATSFKVFRLKSQNKFMGQESRAL
jgi:hypothetical protein